MEKSLSNENKQKAWVFFDARKKAGINITPLNIKG